MIHTKNWSEMDLHQKAECLQRALNPKSIAVVGASERNFYGRTVLENLKRHGYDGDIIAINPRAEEVQGFKCYPSLREAPSADLVVLAVSRDHLIQVVEDAACSGASAVVALTSGLSETHEQHWIDIEAKARSIADEAGMVVIGPNGLGLIGRAHGAFAWGAPVPWQIDEGRTALIMESGGLLCGSLAGASALGLGLAHAASIGNGHSVGVTEWIAALTFSDDVDQIGLMLEAFPDWTEFSAAVRLARENGKTLYAIKSGKSEAGARVAATHTGALAGSYATAAALLAQLGIQECASMGGMLTALTLHQRFGVADGKNLAVLAASGGAAGIVADASADRGIGLWPFSAQTQEAITGMVGILDPSNPLDLGGQALSKPDEFATAVETVLRDPDVAAALYLPSLGLPSDSLPDHKRLLKLVAKAAKAAGKPVIVTQLTYADSTAEVVADYRADGDILVSPSLEYALDGIGPWLRTRIGDDRAGTSLSHGGGDFAAAASDQAVAMPSEYEIKKSLAARGIAVPKAVTYKPGATPEIFPFEAAVLKGISPGVTHKSQAGLVALGLRTIDQLRDAEATFREAARANHLELQEFLLEEMVPEGHDLFLSISEQPVGTVVTLGHGGTDVEERADVGFLGWPATSDEVDRFVRETVTEIDGVQRDGLVEVLNELIDAYQEEGFSMLECNPVRIHESGVSVLDAVAIPRAKYV